MLAHYLSRARDQFLRSSMALQQAAQAAEQRDPLLKGVVGIQNMGNTCYSNSTLQLLRSCPEWNAFCLTQNFKEQLQHVPEDNTNKRVLLAYQDLLTSLWSAYKPAYVRPLGFISEVRKAVKDTPYEMFGIPIPNDSHEFLVYLLDHFHEALTQTIPYSPASLPEDPRQRMRQLAENGWNQFLARNTSELVRLFFGMMRKTIHCTACKNNTYQWEHFNVLKVPCEGTTFQDWIRNEVNEISDIDGYRCEVCKVPTSAKKYSHLWRLPSCLFITLHRFQFNGHKVMTPCPYEGAPISFQEFFAEECDEAEKQVTYELRGVSDHHGTHMGGHYTAQFKHPISHQWWWMDDEKARALEHPQFSTSNYIFFFRQNRH